MKVLFCLLLLSFYVCDAQKSTSKKQPVKAVNQSAPDFTVAIKFLDSYANLFYTKSKNRISIEKWLTANALVTPSYKAVYKALVDSAKASDPEMGLDFDPILDAQDVPEHGFAIISTDPAHGFARVEGIGKDWKGFTVAVKVIKLNNKWLVDGSGYINIPDSRRESR